MAKAEDRSITEIQLATLLFLLRRPGYSTRSVIQTGVKKLLRRYVSLPTLGTTLNLLSRRGWADFMPDIRPGQGGRVRHKYAMTDGGRYHLRRVAEVHAGLWGVVITFE